MVASNVSLNKTVILKQKSDPRADWFGVELQNGKWIEVTQHGPDNKRKAKMKLALLDAVWLSHNILDVVRKGQVP
jgi:hypothetical protein